MSRSFHVPIAPGRKIGAWVCLAAALLLWSPLWAAAWQAKATACCDGGMCAVHGHAKPEPKSQRAAEPSGSPMECEHQSGVKAYAGMTNCSLTCCHDANPALTAAVVFLLPQQARISQPADSLKLKASSAVMETGLVFDPPSPPPRIPLLSI
jgi:hypothetical protein